MSMLNQVEIPNPATVLTLAGLNDNPPRNAQELGEMIDAVLSNWSEVLADEDNTRDGLDERILEIVLPYLNK